MISPKKIISDFKTDYEINLPYQQAYNGIKLVHKDMYGDDVKAYTDLVWYVKKVEETNEGSIVDFQYDDSTEEFKRLFLAYGALIKVFEYCRAMLYLDATFLTGRFKGCLMAATAKNGNDEFYPIAYGIVSHEDGANWVWFLKNLKKVVKGRQIVFLSDQGTGLLYDVPEVFPDAYHSYWYYHMKQKIPVQGDDQLYPHMLNHWRHAVYALTEGGYNKAVKDLIDLECGHVVRWMEKQGPEHWSNAFFEGCRYGEVASSVAESVNNWVKDEKRMPVSALVNTIRMKLMEVIHKRHKISETMTSRLTPDYENKLKELTDEGNSWIVIPAGDTLFEVVADHRYAVNLEIFHCSCNRWKVYGFPCSHAIQCILLSGKQVYDFVQPYFTSSWYKTLYSFAIHPVPDSEKENESSDNVRVIPPPVKKGPGRPKTERFQPKSVKMKSEKRKIRCGNCKRLSNHNSRTCPNQEVHDFSGI